MRTIWMLVPVIAVLAGASPAFAQTADNSACRGSALRANLVGDPTVVNSEPVVANSPGAPCADGSVSTVQRTTVGPVTAEAAAAFSTRGELGTGAAAALIEDANVALGGLTVTVQGVQATALVSCSGTTPVLSSTSRVVGLIVNGNEITLPPNDGFFELDLGPLGRIALNEEIVEGTRLTRRAVSVTTPVGDVVLGEAIVAHGAEACKPLTPGGPTGPTGPGLPRVCPEGATYDPERNLCVIREGGGTQGVIIVGRPYEGPHRGRVVALDELPRSLRNSPCAKGPGPRFAIIGTSRSDRITGTNRADRIMTGRGRDKVSAGRGNDCVDGGPQGDVLGGNQDNDRVYGMSGKDALRGGFGADKLRAGKGRDTMIDGFGDRLMSGGGGADAINAAQAGRNVKRIRCGRGRDILRINRNESRRHRGCERVHVIR